MKKIIAVLLSCLIATGVRADACGAALTGVFTAAQATKLCSTFGEGLFGTLANNTYIVARNAANTANLDVLKVDATDDTVLNADTGDTIKLSIAGTAEVTVDNDSITYSGTAATLQSGGSLIFKADADAQRILTFDASSDTALTLLFGDGATAAQTYQFGPGTADASDDGRLNIGHSAIGRGAVVSVYGNERTGGVGGAVYIDGGDVGATADLVARLNHASAEFAVKNSSNANILAITDGGAATLTGTLVGTSTITSSGTSSIGWSIVAGADTACNTTCTFACVMGFADTGGVDAAVDCADASADSCLCAGAS